MAGFKEEFDKLLPDDQVRVLDSLDADTSRPLLSDPPRENSWRPARGEDRAGMPPLPELVRMEQNAFRSLSPRRRRWKKLDEFEQRIAGLEQRHAAAQADLVELLERQRTAPDRDAAALAEWHLADAEGERPAPEADSLADAVRAAERDRDALQAAIETVLADKQNYVTANRSKLAADAAKDTAAARSRYDEAIVALEGARGQLVDARLTELWALTYPSPVAAVEPRFLGSLARNLADRLRRVGMTAGLDVAQLGRLLREDAEAVATAIDAEQRALIEGHGARRTGAVWNGSPEHKQQAAADRQAEIDQHIREWGRPPDWALP